MLLFLLTICTAVSFHNFLHLPPMVGMMTGLAYLKFFGYYLQKTHNQYAAPGTWSEKKAQETLGDMIPFEIYQHVARAEWDTLLFFYGVVLCVGGLGFLGYLAVVAQVMYIDWGPTFANAMVGILSAIVDNIPVMFAVLTMNPDMSQGQWLLVTLTAGVGGSMLSIGSAAGVALMGKREANIRSLVISDGLRPLHSGMWRASWSICGSTPVNFDVGPGRDKTHCSQGCMRATI